jgi:hypothetical protein
MVLDRVGGCWLVEKRLVVEQVGILADGWKDGCGASENIG